MNTTTMTSSPRPSLFSGRTTFTTLFAAALLLVTGWQARAQNYTLSNAWNVAAGSGNLTGGSDAGNRGLAYNAVSNVVFVPYRAGGSSFAIYAYDGTTGATLNGSTGALGSLGLNCDQAGCGTDGTLYGCPLNTGASTGSPVKLYSWTNWAGSSNYLCYQSTNAADPLFLFTGTKRVGDTMCVTGSGTNTLILLGVGGQNLWLLLSTTDGLNFTSTLLTNASSVVTSGQNVYSICFYTNNTFLVLPQNKTVASIVQFPTNFAGLSSPVATTLLGTLPISDSGLAGFMSYSPAGKLLGTMTNATSSNPSGVFVYSATNNTATNVAATTFASPNSNGNGTGGVALGGQGLTNWIYAMDTDNGLHAYQIVFTTAPIAPIISSQPTSIFNPAFAPQTLSVGISGSSAKPLSYQWYMNSASNTTGAIIIGGATNSSLTVVSAVTNYYFVVVTNIAGGQTSSVALISDVPSVTNSVVTPILSLATGSANTNLFFLANDDNTRGMAYDPITSRLVVANKNGGAHVYLLDANTGNYLGQLNTTGMNPNGALTFTIDQVVVADDGVVYAGDLAINNAQSFNLTSWSSATTNATAYAAYTDVTSGSTLANLGDRWGDNMTVRGSGANTQVLVGSRSGTNVILFTTTDGQNFTPNIITVPNTLAGFAGLGIAFGSGNTIWGKTYGGDLYEIQYDTNFIATATVLQDYKFGSQFPSADNGVAVDATHGILGSINLNDQNPDLQLYQLTGNSNAPVMFDQSFFSVYNPSANGNKLGVVSMKYPRVYAMDVDIGIIGVAYDVPTSTPPSITQQPVGGTIYASSIPYTFTVGVSGTLPLYYQWQYNTTSNLATATNIPGATAASYTLNPPTAAKSGWYDVVITNFGGGKTSAAVQLTVITPVTTPYVTNIWTLAAGSQPFLDVNNYGARGLAYDTNTQLVLVCNHNSTEISALSATNGTYLGDLNTAGLPAGTFVLDQIGVGDDGVLYAGNLVVPGDGNKFSIVSYPAPISVGEAPTTYAYSADPGNGSGDRWGDTMAVRGSGTSTQILLGSYGQGAGPGTNVALLTTTDGSTFTAQTIGVDGVPAGFAGLGIAFGSGNTFWCKGGRGFNLRQVAFDPTGATPATVLQTYIAGTQTPSGFTGLGVDVANNLLFGTSFDDTPNDFEMYQLTGTTNSPVLANQTFSGSENANSQFNAAAAVKFPYAFGLDVNNGLVALYYAVPPAPLLRFPVTVANVPGVGLVLSWPTVAGHNYQVQSMTSLLGSWSNAGSPIAGTGGTVTYTNPISGPAKFFQVIGQ
jgi:hypothetical protein